MKISDDTTYSFKLICFQGLKILYRLYKNENITFIFYMLIPFILNAFLITII